MPLTRLIPRTSQTLEPARGPVAPQECLPRGAAVRVAVVCDFLEEEWPSMDLAGDMLCRHLAEDNCEKMTVSQLRPVLRRRFSHIPLLGEKLASNADRLVNRFADYPRWLGGRRTQFDLFHLVDHSYAQLIHSLPAERTVVTCHDLDTFGCLLEPDRDPRPRWYRAMARRTLEGFRKAAHVLAVSAATRDQLLRHGLFPPERISVVANGAHPSCSPLPDPDADAVAARLLQGDSSDTVWLLNVGSTIPRKRVDVLLRAFAAIHREVPKARLLRVGGPFTPAQRQLAEKLSIGHAVLVLPFLERAVLAAIYRRADLLLHTAEAEGFGLPLIEAMACGCPVVASDIAVLREVGGAAAAYCPVAGVQAWKDRVIRLLEERAHHNSAWELRRSEALARAARFSWAENARRTARVYGQVLAEIQPG
jgi:glycosyltransferase involved in cell wall biosynthesis